MTRAAGGGGATTAPPSIPESPYAWRRLAASLAISTVGGVGIWSVVVALPAVQAEFGAARGGASLPYTATMLGFAFGGVAMGRLADRYGVLAPLVLGALALCAGYVGAAQATALWQFVLLQGVLVGFLGSSTVFGPLVADISLWFDRRRGMAVGICASGNYLAGTIWPPLIQAGIDSIGWRATYVAVGIACVTTMLPLAMVLRRPPPPAKPSVAGAGEAGAMPVSARTLQALLIVAGLTCCLAMAMPQVHIVAYCGDLGYGVARGTEMLSLMLLCGIISRLGSGLIADRIGGLATLLLGSMLQAVALGFYLFFDSLVSLYLISAMFGLFQGGIVPSYAVIVREHFPAAQAATRVGVVLMATLFGMALGGWLSGLVFDVTGSYAAAFLNGIAWNAMNLMIIVPLLLRSLRRRG